MRTGKPLLAATIMGRAFRAVSIFGALSTAAAAVSPPVTISLETSWPAPPLVLEILETVYDESPSSYFPLLHLLSTRLDSATSLTPESVLTTSLDLISSHSLLPSPLSISTFNLALALHTPVPRIEAEYAWYEHAVLPLETGLGVESCGGWVEWRGKGFCVAEELQRDMELSIEEATHRLDQRPPSLPFDHVSPSATASLVSPQAVFYYDPSSSSSSQLLNYLAHHASIYPDFTYIVRYKPSSERHQGQRIQLSGYGAEMALKKTDYLVVDDRATAQSSSNTFHDGVLQKTSSSNESGIFSHVFDKESLDFSAPLTPEEIQDISYQASSLIMSSDDPLEALLHVSQDFPKYSSALARQVEISDDIRLKRQIASQRGQATPGFYINGKAHGAEINAYSLLKIIRAERDLVLSLTSLGLNPKQAVDLVADPLIGQSQTEDDPGEGIVDASDRLEGGEVIVWWNDIEKDQRYKNWPAHLQGYLRQIYPGQFHQVRRNTWNLVFVLDLTQVSSLDIIVNSISPMIQRGLPIRFGIVPMFETESNDNSAQLAKLFHYTVKTFGRAATRDFFAAIAGAIPNSPAAPGVVDLATARKAYELMAADSTKAALPFDEVIASETYDERLGKTTSYLSRLVATKEEAPMGHLFVNGKHALLGGHWTAVVQSEMNNQLSLLQEQIALGEPPEDVSTFFYDLPSSSSRRSKLIIPGTGENKLKVYNLLEVFQSDVTGKIQGEFVYAENGRGAPITFWIIGDLDSEGGRRAVVDGLKHLQTPECASRLGFIHIPTQRQVSSGESRLSTLIYQLMAQSSLNHVGASDLLQLIEELDQIKDNLDEDGKIFSDDAQKVFEGTPLHALTSGGWSAADVAAAADFWSAGSKIAQFLSVRADKPPYLLANGRLVGPITSTTFAAEDFDILELFELRKRVKPVIDLLKTMYDDISVFDRKTWADMISITSSIVASAYKPLDAEGIFMPLPVSRDRFYRKLDDGPMSFTVGDPDTAILQVAAVLDPVSEHAQRWSTILQKLSTLENVAVSVYLEPNPMPKELKLQRFYRSSLPSQLAFDVDGAVVAPAIVFNGLPSSPIYTLGLDTPPSWVASPKSSPYDLDNLVLGNIHEPVHVLFQLKQLLIEGHAREGMNTPPRGLQLQLTTNGLEVASDTQVMANLGYLQFKATPGMYDLAIRPGRGTEVYELETIGAKGWDSPDVNVTGTSVILSSFEGVTIYPSFRRREGMERADVLQETEVVEQETLPKAVFQRMKSLVGLSSDTSVAKPKTRHADISIFTVASGLLYERFASIMILSVMRHTRSSVKFWFIENFLSPTFIAFIPKLAEEYGFQYEFVTYKWPHWLRAQTEKQRIIWAYKILFLDVLFPMDLDKVIFVDADQIVRTDMKELVDVDLKGRVYGYPPMGNSREEMEGFRFWKTGYWKDALRGRPYHISALYVVDLKRFRQLATGDRLRGQYHALSADPNSLANLDQDLPNSMQDVIPIFTLDQDWLWCQTWCSDESLSTAKTIDLCQNPLTKEPKLVRARQIPEWDVYDREIAAFAARLSDEGEEGGALAASVEDLAADAGAKAVQHDVGEDTEGENNVQDAESWSDDVEEGRGRIEDEL